MQGKEKYRAKGEKKGLTHQEGGKARKMQGGRKKVERRRGILYKVCVRMSVCVWEGRKKKKKKGKEEGGCTALNCMPWASHEQAT
jgi:hypothetical protein